MSLFATCLLTIALCFQGAGATTTANNRTVVGKTNGAFFALSVADVLTLSRWYQEKLGFRVLSQGEAPNKIATFAWLEGQGTIIKLIQHSQAKERKVAAPSVTEPYQLHGIFKVGLVVTDLDGIYRALKRRNVPLA